MREVAYARLGVAGGRISVMTLIEHGFVNFKKKQSSLVYAADLIFFYIEILSIIDTEVNNN